MNRHVLQQAASPNDRAVKKAVMELTPDQREAIQLAYFDGLTQSEIADRLREPLGTVKARIRRGVQRLEQVVKRTARVRVGALVIVRSRIVIARSSCDKAIQIKQHLPHSRQ